jgi:hypothetical protein
VPKNLCAQDGPNGNNFRQAVGRAGTDILAHEMWLAARAAQQTKTVHDIGPQE